LIEGASSRFCVCFVWRTRRARPLFFFPSFSLSLFRSPATAEKNKNKTDGGFLFLVLLTPSREGVSECALSRAPPLSCSLSLSRVGVCLFLYPFFRLLFFARVFWSAGARGRSARARREKRRDEALLGFLFLLSWVFLLPSPPAAAATTPYPLPRTTQGPSLLCLPGRGKSCKQKQNKDQKKRLSLSLAFAAFRSRKKTKTPLLSPP
jgi:hypothetical protein